MSILVKGMEIPTSCVKCEWRDAEVGGDCELMICNPFESYEEQYKHCPFQEISKRYSIVPIPPHGRLIDAGSKTFPTPHRNPSNDYMKGWNACLRSIQQQPTIIPAEEGET